MRMWPKQTFRWLFLIGLLWLQLALGRWLLHQSQVLQEDIDPWAIVAMMVLLGVFAGTWLVFCQRLLFAAQPDRPLTIVSYQSQPTKTAWIEPLAVGMSLPTMPLFLRGASYVNLPLEPSYQETWSVLPIELKRIIENSASA